MEKINKILPSGFEYGFDIVMEPAPAPAKPKIDPNTKPGPVKPKKDPWNPTKPKVAPRPKA